MAAAKAETDPELWMMVGMLYENQDNTEKAVEAYQQASDAAPMDLLLHLQLLGAYQRMGKEELVKVEEEKILAINEAYEEMQQAQEAEEPEAAGQAADEPGIPEETEDVEEPQTSDSSEEASAAE